MYKQKSMLICTNASPHPYKKTTRSMLHPSKRSGLSCHAPGRGGRRAAAQPRGSRPRASSGGHERGGGARQQAAGGASGCRRQREDEIDLLAATSL